MSVMACLFGKVEAGLVRRDAAEKLREAIADREAARADTLAAAERPQTYIALEIADAADRAAARQYDLALRSIEAQLGALRVIDEFKSKVAALRSTPGDFGFGTKAPAGLGNENKSVLWQAISTLFWRDPRELATWGNVQYLARTIKGEAHAQFAQAIEAMRSKNLGFKRETVLETDVLGALYDAPGAGQEARAIAKSWNDVAKSLFDQFNAAGGAIPERADWRLPNPTLDRNKVASVNRAEFIADMEAMNGPLHDFETGKVLDAAGRERVFGEIYDNAIAGWVDGPPTAAQQGRTMLANSRSDPRIIVLKDAASWQGFAGKYGAHDSPFEAMMAHIARMSDDVAKLRVLGPNPEGLKRYISSLFDRELETLTVSPAEGASAQTKLAALKANRQAEASVRKGRKDFETAWSHLTGVADQPVDTAFAKTMGDMRSGLVSAQMGSAVISSLSDNMTLAMTARMNGLPVMDVVGRATRELLEPGSEVRAAQMGLVADAMVQGMHSVDRFVGETVRSGRAAQLAGATIRASGLRRWSAALRNAYGLESMALYAREAGKAFGELDARIRDSFARYGIDASDWDVIRATSLHEERPNAFLLRPMDVRAQGGEAAGAAADKLKRLIDTEMDYAVIDADPRTRAMLLGDTRAGTVTGEAVRATLLYKTFPITFLSTHLARMTARGWDGSRLSHGAIAFMGMWALGVVSMQAKQIANGKGAYELDPTTKQGQRAWAAGLLQGGGLGIFGDFVGADMTKFGNSLPATIAGAQVAAAESVWKFAYGNVQRSLKGEPTHWAGDALYTAARFVPGSSLWYARTAFQRAIVDQAALAIDPRTPERFRRMERQAQEEFHQQFWWRPGEALPGGLR